MILNYKDFLSNLHLNESEYVIQKGDTLSGIAKKLGVKNWKELYDLNKEAIGKNPNSLKIGTKLKSPVKKERKVEPVDNLFSDNLNKKSKEEAKSKEEIKKIKKEEYENWESIKNRVGKINSMSQEDIIKEYNKNTEKKYLILNKNQGILKLYQGAKELGSFKVGTGENIGDEQTRTVVKDGKVYWEKGNKMTGAGTFIASGSSPKNSHYSNAPSWNFKNENGIEVPMAIHSSFGNRTAKIEDDDPKNNRLSNGCINGLAKDLKKIYELGFREGDSLYILPDDSKNRFQISNRKLVFQSKDSKVNRSKFTLNYVPIKIEIDENKFKREVFQALDFNDEEEYKNNTKPFIKALEENKKNVMLAAKINGDVYNDIAKIAFGIYGTESNYGDTHSAAGNLLRAGKKFISRSSSSSPDYLSKATTYGQSKESNSVGLTQIRFNMLDQPEKEILKKLGITDNKQLLKPEGSALATLGILASRYNNQLTDAEKKDPYTNLAKKWNVRKNYPDRVKQNSKYITIKELS